MVRVRVSEGFKVGEHYGNFHMRARHLVCSPCYNADSTMGVLIKHNENKKNITRICFFKFSVFQLVL